MENEEARLIDLPKIMDPRGNLSFIECGKYLPFEIKRCYWVYDVPGGMVRHARALKGTTEMIIALSGSFDVRLATPSGEDLEVHLCRSYQGLLVPPMHRRELVNFSTNSVALVLADSIYDPDDYLY